MDGPSVEGVVRRGGVIGGSCGVRTNCSGSRLYPGYCMSQGRRDGAMGQASATIGTLPWLGYASPRPVLRWLRGRALYRGPHGGPSSERLARRAEGRGRRWLRRRAVRRARPYLYQALTVGNCRSLGSASYLVSRMLASHPGGPVAPVRKRGGVSLPLLAPRSSP